MSQRGQSRPQKVVLKQNQRLPGSGSSNLQLTNNYVITLNSVNSEFNDSKVVLKHFPKATEKQQSYLLAGGSGKKDSNNYDIKSENGQNENFDSASNMKISINIIETESDEKDESLKNIKKLTSLKKSSKNKLRENSYFSSDSSIRGEKNLSVVSQLGGEKSNNLLNNRSQTEKNIIRINNENSEQKISRRSTTSIQHIYEEIKKPSMVYSLKKDLQSKKSVSVSVSDRQNNLIREVSVATPVMNIRKSSMPASSSRNKNSQDKSNSISINQRYQSSTSHFYQTSLTEKVNKRVKNLKEVQVANLQNPEDKVESDVNNEDEIYSRSRQGTNKKTVKFSYANNSNLKNNNLVKKYDIKKQTSRSDIGLNDSPLTNYPIYGALGKPQTLDHRYILHEMDPEKEFDSSVEQNLKNKDLSRLIERDKRFDDNDDLESLLDQPVLNRNRSRSYNFGTHTSNLDLMNLQTSKELAHVIESLNALQIVNSSKSSIKIQANKSSRNENFKIKTGRKSSPVVHNNKHFFATLVQK